METNRGRIEGLNWVMEQIEQVLPEIFVFDSLVTS